MVNSWKGYMAQLRLFNLRVGEFIEASNVLTRGLGGCWGAAGFLTFAECDKLEGSWRHVFNQKYSRVRGTPRFELYGSRRTCSKVHLFEVTTAALWRTATRALGERLHSDLCHVSHCALALAMYTWGCRTNPSRWNFKHIMAALEQSLATQEA